MQQPQLCVTADSMQQPQTVFMCTQTVQVVSLYSDRQTVRQTDRQTDTQTDRQTDVLNQIQFTTHMNLLHVSTSGCHSQGDFQLKTQPQPPIWLLHRRRVNTYFRTVIFSSFEWGRCNSQIGALGCICCWEATWGWHPGAETRRRSLFVMDCIQSVHLLVAVCHLPLRTVAWPLHGGTAHCAQQHICWQHCAPRNSH